MKEPIQVTIQPPVELQPADERFILFLKKCTFPVTEPQIIAWYLQYVQRQGSTIKKVNENGVWVDKECEYDEGTIRTYALNWFDRSLGRVIRKAIIPNEATRLLLPIRGDE